MLRRGSIWLFILIILLAACEQPQQPGQHGLAALVLTFPAANPNLPVIQTAGLFDRVHCTIFRYGEQVFDNDLQHAGGSFQASIELDAGSGYTLFALAYMDSELCYSGANAGFSITAGQTSSVNVPMIAQLPQEPSLLTATAASFAEINLAWSDNSANEAGFIIQRHVNDTTTWAILDTVEKNASSYQDTSIIQGATHYYRVCAYNGAGLSAYSAYAQAYILAPPVAPDNLTANPLSSSQIRLDWNDNSGNEEGFVIESKLNSGSVWDSVGMAGPNITTFQQNGLSPGQSYDYRVYAYNAAGISSYSNVANAVTSQVPPLPPSNLLATAVSTSQINLAWNDNADNEEGFKVERKTGIAGTWTLIATLAANSTTYESLGLSPLTEYYYRVYAYNSLGNSTYSNENSATTFEPAPTAPSNLSITSVSTTWINLAWTDNSNNEDGFIIERKVGQTGIFAAIDTVAAGTTTYQSTGLTPGQYYGYTICGFNGGGNSSYSNMAGATTNQVPPAAPSGLSATAVSANEIDIVWTDNSSNESGFVIERKTGIGGSWSVIDSVGTNTVYYQNTGLLQLTDYYYRVKAFNVVGSSLYSNEANDTTFMQAPAAPTNLLAMTVSWSQINLTWNDLSVNEDGFILQRKIGAAGNWSTIDSLAAETEAYSDTGLAPLTEYYYRVCAFNAGGNSGWSNPGNTTTYGLLYVDHFDSLNTWQVSGSGWSIGSNGYAGNCAQAVNAAPDTLRLTRTIDFNYNTTLKLWVNKNLDDSVTVQFLVDDVQRWTWGGSAIQGAWTHLECSVPAGQHVVVIEVINTGEAYVDEFEVYAAN